MRDIRVGVVEDDPTACQRVLYYLNQYHSETGTEFTISVFDDGEKIVEKYTPTYDILLLDIEMKHMDGMAAARQIRERDDSVVIVFITAATVTASDTAGFAAAPTATAPGTTAAVGA